MRKARWFWLALALSALAQWWQYDNTSRYLADLQSQIDALQGPPPPISEAR